MKGEIAEALYKEGMIRVETWRDPETRNEEVCLKVKVLMWPETK